MEPERILLTWKIPGWFCFAVRCQDKADGIGWDVGGIGGQDPWNPTRITPFGLPLGAITYFIALSRGSDFNGFQGHQRRLFKRSGRGQ